MPFTDDEIKALPARIAETVQKMLEEEFKKAVQKIAGCRALCAIPTWIAAGNVAKSVHELRPLLAKLKDSAQDAGQSDLGKAVSFPKDLITLLAKTVGETFAAVKEFFVKAASMISEDIRSVVLEIGEVLHEFVKLLSGGGFICGVPELSKLTKLDDLVPEALKNAPAKIFRFLCKLADPAIAKFGVIAMMFSALVNTADVVAQGGIEVFKQKFTSDDDETSAVSILALTKIGLTIPENEDAVCAVFKNAAMDDNTSAETKAKSAAALTLIMTANAAKRAANAVSNLVDRLPSISLPKIGF
eukprot:ANDGO_08169.mRNA.1 hypothetical protein